MGKVGCAVNGVDDPDGFVRIENFLPQFVSLAFFTEDLVCFIEFADFGYDMGFTGFVGCGDDVAVAAFVFDIQLFMVGVFVTLQE